MKNTSMQVKKHSKDRLTIGFTGIADFRSIIGQELSAGINQAAKDYDVNLVNFLGVIKYSLADDLEFFNHFKKKLKFINTNNIDGIISWASSFQAFINDEEIEKIHGGFAPLPLVSIGMKIKDSPTIILDNKHGVREVMNHLIKFHGYKKIAFIGCRGRRQYNDRFNVYREMLELNGIKYDPELQIVLEDLDRKHVKNAVNEFFKKRKLALNKDIEAVITVSDIIALDLIEELELNGIKVPSDIAVVGFNNQLESIRCMTPITTVDPHFFNFGYKAVQSLLSKIEDKDGEAHDKLILMPCDLILRQSCGCFEDLITRAEVKAGNTEDGQLIDAGGRTFDEFISGHYEDLTIKIADSVVKFDEKFSRADAMELLTCFIDDITGRSSNKFLYAVKKYFFNFNKLREDTQILWQNLISEIRTLLSPYLKNHKDITDKAENIYHQSRLMIDIINSYMIFSKKGDVYKMNALARIAAEFASAMDMAGIFDLIRNHLHELDIPGIYLVIYDEIKADIGRGRVAFAFNADDSSKSQDSILTVASGCLIPKRSLPRGRYSLMFELAFYKNNYIGYILFEMGPVNVPLYDSVRNIMSPSLYAAILMKNKFDTVNTRELLLKNPKISRIIKKDGNNAVDFESKSINAYKIIDYLSTHIGELTNLNKIAMDLNTSKSSLIRKTKILTGYSLQKLHEMLKIERSKLLLANKFLNISEISERLGYQNIFYFSNVFKKHTGMSPKKWMESNS